MFNYTRLSAKIKGFLNKYSKVLHNCEFQQFFAQFVVQTGQKTERIHIKTAVCGTLSPVPKEKNGGFLRKRNVYFLNIYA